MSIDYYNALKLNHKAFMKHLSINASKRYSINNVLIVLDEWNDNFKYTEYFKAKRNGIISRFKNERFHLDYQEHPDYVPTYAVEFASLTGL